MRKECSPQRRLLPSRSQSHALNATGCFGSLSEARASTSPGLWPNSSSSRLLRQTAVDPRVEEAIRRRYSVRTASPPIVRFCFGPAMLYRGRLFTLGCCLAPSSAELLRRKSKCSPGRHLDVLSELAARRSLTKGSIARTMLPRTAFRRNVPLHRKHRNDSTPDTRDKRTVFERRKAKTLDRSATDHTTKAPTCAVESAATSCPSSSYFVDL